MSDSGRLRILIAANDSLFRSYLRAQLSNLGHLVVAEAEDGQGAVSLARQLCPDLVLADVKMSTMDGLEASRRSIGRDYARSSCLVHRTSASLCKRRVPFRQCRLAWSSP